MGTVWTYLKSPSVPAARQRRHVGMLSNPQIMDRNDLEQKVCSSRSWNNLHDAVHAVWITSVKLRGNCQRPTPLAVTACYPHYHKLGIEKARQQRALLIHTAPFSTSCV